MIYLEEQSGRDRRTSEAPTDRGSAELRIWCEQNVPFPKIDDRRLLAFAEELKPLFIVDTLTGFSRPKTRTLPGRCAVSSKVP